MFHLCPFFFFLMIRRPPRSTLSSSSAASDVYKRQEMWAGADHRDRVKLQAQNRRKMEGERYEAELEAARREAFQDRQAMERRRNQSCSEGEKFRPDGFKGTVAEPMCARDPAVDREEMLRVAREEAYRERKALQAKYQANSEAELMAGPALDGEVVLTQVAEPIVGSPVDKEEMLRLAREEAFRERKALEAKYLSLIHISEPTRLLSISYAVFCLKKKKKKKKH
eukprot:TRINITY_DN55714_c0_g1_i1.p1 TRINITY_DN55714_c0_g1~~TRINITY_DN55714_c0_g1_i1.p1  ORF type:complete len:225 (-),score=80.39 TRINITY_DN55714_c0_g1_i1:80-754(-)